MPDFDPPPDVAIRRIAGRWRVGDEEFPDLISAMVTADLLASELGPFSVGRPPRGENPRGEVERLALTIRQLERALTARVTIEQAIGIISERRRCAPREAFERIRTASRDSGRRVHDLAYDVVRSIAQEHDDLPADLARRRDD